MKDKINNIVGSGCYIVFMLLLIGGFLLVPLAVIWALNTLFPLGIETTWATWLAVLVLLAVARAGQEQAGRRQPAHNDWWAAEPDVVRMVHGVPARVHRIKALGNAQVPAVAALAWQTLISK